MTLPPYDDDTFEDRQKMRHRLMDPDRDTQQNKMEIRKGFRPSGDRGFSHSDAVKAAEEMRMEDGGSRDPIYPSQRKNKGGCE